MIKVLDKSVSELIAAGEVIDRPASVVKELIENSVDAGAKSITVEIKNGGISFMRISDDGSGIPHEECPTAFLRHATSKVRTGEDLNSISTLGFRGEALASVSAVGRVGLLTKTASDSLGTSYKIEGGEQVEYERAGCPDGTTIMIRDLFFNTPARLKFLKKDVTEGNYVQSVVEKAALVNPGISFRFIRDNNLIRVTPGDGKLYSAIYAIYGKSQAVSMIPVDCSQNGINVNGFVSKPLFCRNNRTFQNFYINLRYIRSTTCTAALEEAYRNSIMTGKFPACVLNIEMEPADVDVNVHPAKTEVRFAGDRAVFSAVHVAVKNALLNADSEQVEDFEQVREIPTAETVENREVKTDFPVNPTVLTEKESGTVEFNSSKTEYVTTPVLEVEYKYINADSLRKKPTPVNEKVNVQAKQASLVHDVCDYEQVEVLGELFMNYIVCEQGESLVLIDKHAADERLRFDRLKQELRSDSQLLIEPLEMHLDSESAGWIIEASAELSQIGLKVESGDLGVLQESGKIRVTAIPTLLDVSQVEELLCEVSETLKSGKSVKLGNLEIVDEILHRVACRSAVKAGDKSTTLDIRELAQRVLLDSRVRFCPHGRPIVVKITKNELEKKFKRII
ncbi:MAG: DNA mismatch repair endonuclease MutL [Oscillospiraceae bacterium]|nr:DNA mismatch repair endonuclease MutL [Oscillospiraceae bacterium]